MNKWSILVLLFVFAVPFKAYSDNFMIASSDEITLAQIAPVSPQAGNVRSPAGQTPPAINIPPDHALAASKELLDAAIQMWRQCPHIDSGLMRFGITRAL